MRAAARYWALESALGAGPVAGLLALVALWGSHDAAQTDKVTHFLINVVLVLALQLFSGNTGILSFGQMAFVGTGAYVAAILTLDPILKGTILTGLPHFLETAHLGWVPALLAAAGAGGLLALVSGVPILRLDQASAVIAILALVLIADIVFGAWVGVTNGGAGLYGLPAETTVWRAFAVAAVAVLIARLFKDSKTGLLLQASREDALAAASAGVPVRRYRVRAWVLNGILSGAGGAVFAWWIGTISPTDFFLAPTFALIVMFVVGGAGTVSGAVLGAAIVTAVQDGLRQYEDNHLNLGVFSIGRLTGLTQFVLVVVILLAMAFKREGLIARREPDEWLRRLLGRGRHGEDVAAAPPTAP
jgi:branched-chain amino acid transport system permease protein